MTIYKSAMQGQVVALQTAATTGNGNPISPVPSLTNHTIRIKTSAGVSAGAIQPESADNPSYTGTWNPIGGGPITVPAASSELEYNFTGAYKAIRARISTDVVGGTIGVEYNGAL